MDTDATDKQMDYLLVLKDRVSTGEFYDAVAAVTGRRSTLGLTKRQASAIIEELLQVD